MSVTICADGSFPDQAAELLTYLARPHPEEEREAYVAKFGALDGEQQEERVKLVESIVEAVRGLGDGTEREVEGFFNLIVAVLLSLYSVDSPEFAKSYTKVLGAVTADKRRELRRAQYQILSNLHNLLPVSSPLRRPTLSSLISLATTHGDIAAVGLSPAAVRRWVGEWDAQAVSDEERVAFVDAVAAGVEKEDVAGKGAASYPYRLLQLSLLPSSSTPSPAAASALSSTLTLALRLPTLFDLSSLLSLPSLTSSPSTPLLSLARILASGSLSDFTTWSADAANAQALKDAKVDAAVVERKMRNVALAGLAASASEGVLSYDEIAQALSVQVEQVEAEVIDAIRLNLISAKLSQPTRTVRVQRAYVRAFGPEQWKALQGRLAEWEGNLAGVEDVVREAQRVAGGGSGGVEERRSVAA